MENNGQPEAPKVELTAMEQRFAEVDMQILIEEWKTAATHTRQYTVDFPALDTIVDGIPVTREDGSPYVGDTTIAGLVRQTPRLALQNIPIFGAVINGTKNSFHAIMSSFFLRDSVFNEDTFGKGLLSTAQIGTEQALAHGYAPFMTGTGTMFDEFGTTMKLLHYSDVAPEPGISDHSEAGYDYVVSNITKSRLMKIIKNAKANPNTTWNVAALERLSEIQPETNKYSIYQGAARKDEVKGQAVTYTIVIRFEVGKEGEFVTFSPQIEDTPLRVLDNRSKFGFPRVNFLVIDPAALSPFGTSRVRLAAPNQNLMNVFYQNIGSMLLLNSKPPILKRGRFTKPVQLKQGAVWETLDQNAKAELVEMSNSSLQQFVPMAQQFASQIQNIFGMPTGTINGGTNSVGYSKTAPGVKMQQTAQDTSINQVTKILENFLRQYALVALDTMLAEQTVDEEDPEAPNEDVVIVDDEAKEALNRLNPGTVGDDNEVTINWNSFYAFIKKISVTIELGIGKDELEEKTRADLQDMLVTMTQNADPNDVEKQAKIREIEDRLLSKSIPDSKRMSPVPPAAAAPVMPGAPQGPQTTQISPQVSMTQ